MHLIPKKYSSGFESELYTWRQGQGCFAPQGRGKTESFVIPIPPPNVTGELHLGHALMLAIEDAMVRYARMQGKNTLRIPGTDHAGISTQIVVERDIRKRFKKTKAEFSRTVFVDEIRKRVRKTRSGITSQIEKMGASVDRSREEFTMSEQLSRAVRKAFVTLYNQKKIYRDTYMVNRSPGAQTVLSDLEVDYKQEKVKLYYIKYFVQGKGESLTVATVRPETMFGDVAVAVHPKDRRYKKRIGKNVLIPIVNRAVPIIADETVSLDFGTGVLKITPSHSEEDFIIARKHGLPLECYALDQHNKYTSQAGGELSGKDAYEFMDNLIQYLDEIGNLEQIVDYETKVPYCNRTGVRVQPLLSQQRFFDVSEAAHKVKEALNNQAVAIHPEKFTKQFHNRLDQIRPRCISRQLRRGHRIPVRYDTLGNMYALDEENAVTPTKGKKTVISQIIFNLIADSRLSNPFGLEDLIDLLLQPSLTEQRGLLYEVYVNVYRTKYEKNAKLLKEVEEFYAIVSSIEQDAATITKQGALVVDLLDQATQVVTHGDEYRFVYQVEGEEKELIQDEDVLDTRFSSGLRPFSILGRPEQTSDLAKYYPSTVLETGYDIIFFRVIRMMIMGISLTDTMPFKNVYFHGLVRDEAGQKMSKSSGNGIDPLEMIKKYGADAMRGSLLSGTTPGNDQKFTEQKVEYMRKFVNKLRNATRFVQHMIEVDYNNQRSYADIQTVLQEHQKQLNDYDKRIINKLNEVVTLTSKYFDKFMLGEGLQEAVQFVRHDFCDRYVEIVKNEKSELTPAVLLYVLGASFKLLHPLFPFVTEKLWQLLGFDEILMTSVWPTEIVLDQKNYRFNLLMDMISQRRMLKQDLKQKSHEEVTLLVQGNKDIHILIQEHESLIKKLLRAVEVKFLLDSEEIPSGFQVSLLMDIKLGVQGVTSKDRKTRLGEFEKMVAEEEQFLQRMRMTISNSDFLGKAPPEVVAEKKQKIEEVKSKIIGLQHEINRLKMQHK